MAKLAILLVLVICVHYSLAGLGGRRNSWKAGTSKWIKSGWKKFVAKSPWGSEGGEKPWAGKPRWGGESEKHQGHGKDRNEEMSDMMMMRMRMKRMFKPLRDLFVRVLDLGPKEKVEGRPEFCGDNECPSFEVLNKTEHYELRKYQPTHWVSTSMLDTKMSKSYMRICFKRLFKYIQGNNEGQQKIKMTVPVTTVMKTDPATEKMNYTMSFYLPPSITNPPTPNEDGVWTKSKGSFKVYVHSFKGYAMSQKTWERHAKMLQHMLKRDGLTGKFYPMEEMYVTAGYDDPMKLFNRHNEVWFLAKDQEA